MTHSLLRVSAATLLTVALTSLAPADEAVSPDAWPRFRGPNGTGVSPCTGLPETLDPKSNLAWKIECGKGASSPIVTGDRLYLNSYNGNERFVECLDAATGTSVWKQTVRKLRDETASNPNSPATCTPVTDGKNVVAFFPDSGLFCFSAEGKQLWHTDMGPLHAMHGIASSPVLLDGLVVMALDQLRGSQLVAYKLSSGEKAWSVPRVDGLTGAYATPSIIARPGAPSLIVTSGPQEFCGYVASTGEKAWSIPGVSNAPVTSPLVFDKSVFLCEPVRRSTTSINLLKPLDANKDGKYTLEEGERSLPMFRLMERIDTDYGNGDGVVDEEEWNAAFGGFLDKGGLVAVNLGDGKKAPEVRWTYRKSLPYIPTPLVLDGVLYMVQDGGIVTSLNPATGDIFHRGRLSQGAKQFYASPVAGDGKLYLVDTAGRLSVLKAGREWEELSSTTLDEPCYASPAICGGRVFVRSAKALYAFGREKATPGQ